MRNDVAMTGEISLRGLVLPVGGIKEKTVAAHRAGIRTVLLPARNRKDLEDIPESVRKELEFVWLERVEDAIAHAIEEPTGETTPLSATGPDAPGMRGQTFARRSACGRRRPPASCGSEPDRSHAPSATAGTARCRADHVNQHRDPPTHRAEPYCGRKSTQPWPGANDSECASGTNTPHAHEEHERREPHVTCAAQAEAAAQVEAVEDLVPGCDPQQPGR